MSPQPGDVIATWSDMAPHVGQAVILATSRHKRRHFIRVSEERFYERRSERWFTVTKEQLEDGECPDEIDAPGQFWSEGAGAAWIDVLHRKPENL